MKIMWHKTLCFSLMVTSLTMVTSLKPSLSQRINPVNPSNPSRPPNNRLVPVGTPVFLRISQADDQALIKINGQPVLSAKWNGGPGSAARSILLHPGVYKLEFIILNTEPSNTGGLFEVRIQGTPLTNERIGLPWGPNSQLGVVYHQEARIVIKERVIPR